jgi:hypothetical protein
MPDKKFKYNNPETTKARTRHGFVYDKRKSAPVKGSIGKKKYKSDWIKGHRAHQRKVKNNGCTTNTKLPPQYVEDLQKDYGKQLTANGCSVGHRQICTTSCRSRSISTRCLYISGSRYWCVPTLS